MDKDLWNSLDKLEGLIGSMFVIEKLLEASEPSIEALEVDKALNIVIGTKEYTGSLQNEMDEALKDIWEKIRLLSKENNVFS